MHPYNAASLYTLVKDRLNDPAVVYFYDEFQKNGIHRHVSEILTAIPPMFVGPVLQTYRSHVTKEKAAFAFALLMTVRGSEFLAASLAAVVDMLWILSIIYDDIEDNDEKRSGLPSAWIEFGRDLSKQSVGEGIAAVLGKLEKDFGSDAAQLSGRLIESGIASLREHRELTVESSFRRILENYRKRSAFHDRFTVAAVYGGDWERKNESGRAYRMMSAVNLGGQILNDLKDFRGDRWYGRDGLSDIRSGLVTVPIKVLWDLMSLEERVDFSSLFGKGTINHAEYDFVLGLYEKYELETRLVSTTRRYYDLFLRLSEQIIDPTYQPYFRRWYGYKCCQSTLLQSG